MKIYMVDWKKVPSRIIFGCQDCHQVKEVDWLTHRCDECQAKEDERIANLPKKSNKSVWEGVYSK